MANKRVPLISLILPAFNERNTIARTLGECVSYFEDRKIPFEIIVSADGTDGTREIVQKIGEKDPRICVIGEDRRMGKGKGIRRGVELATGRFVGFMDADNKTPISQFDKVLPLLMEGAPIVIGSRATPQSKIEVKPPLYRRLGSLGFRYFMRTVTGLRGVLDTQCGFKFFERNAAKTLFSRQRIDGYMFDVEILYLARKLGIPFAQVSVHWKADGDSRLALFRNNLQNIIDLFRIRFASSVS